MKAVEIEGNWAKPTCALCGEIFYVRVKGKNDVYPENCPRCRCTKLGHPTAVKWKPK